MSPPSHRRGAAAGAAILAAAAELLAEEGFAALQIDAVARRAGVSRATVYRRWGNRSELVAAVIASRPGGRPEPPDTGTLAGDLRAIVDRIAAFSETPEGLALLRLFASPDPALRATLDAVRAERDAGLWRILERAAARGEVCSPEAARWAAELLPAACFNRAAILGQPLDPAWRAELVAVLLGIAGGR